MPVFVVIHQNSKSDIIIEGVYTSREKAKETVKKYPNKRYIVESILK